MIKGLLFDYGGTIDTNGLHWAVVLKDSYQQFDVQLPDELFAQAYAYGERSLAINPIIKPLHNFYDVLRLKVEQQFIFIREHGFDIDIASIELIAEHCNQFAKETVEHARPVLKELSADYPMVMVSNFYGNLNAVLEDFGIRELFLDVVESAIVNVRKPNPQIYQLGVERLGLEAKECLVIGDSFSKDIIPAKAIGCRTIWLKGQGWEDGHANNSGSETVTSDLEIKDFREIKNGISILN